MKSEQDIFCEIEFLTSRAYDLTLMLKEWQESQPIKQALELDLMKTQERIKTLRWVLKE